MSRRAPTEFDPRELHRHGGFLRRLARSLYLSEHDSEDLVSEAWTLALATEPRARPGGDGLRAWLARVVRTRAANLVRDRDRRRALEAEVASDEADDASDSGLDLEQQARVLDAVRGLAEPYRTAIYLRYYQDLSPAEIARRLGAPLPTVDSRLVRGRRLLRAALERRLGSDRAAWASLLLPLSSVGPGTAVAGATGGALGAPYLGGWILGSKLKIALTLVVSVAALGIWRWSAPSRPAASPVEAVVRAEPRALQAPPLEPAPEPLEVAVAREVAETPALEPARAAPAAAEPERGRTVPGRALEASGRPLAGVALRFRPAAEAHERARPLQATTDASGDFRFEEVFGAGTIATDDAAWVTVVEGTCEEVGRTASTVVIAARAGSVRVEVRTADGAPVEGAALDMDLPDGFRSRFDLDLDRSSDVGFRARTDARGRAELARSPRLDGLRLRITRSGFAQLEHVLGRADVVPADEPGEHVVLVLEALAGGPDVLQGIVVDEYGDGVPDAEVTMDLLVTETDAGGRFFLDLSEHEPGEHWYGEAGARDDLVAVRPGYLPATLRPRLGADGRPVWPEWVVLQVAEPPLTIRGRVVDGDGVGLAGYKVFLREAHLFDDATLEGTMAGTTDFVHAAFTDADGRFELGGLLDRRYDLAALDEGTLLRAELDDVPAGEREALFEVDTDAFWSEVVGRVVDRRGRPLEGVVVDLYAPTQTARGAQGIWGSTSEREEVATDADGLFGFENVPTSGVKLRLAHADIMHADDLELPTEGATEIGRRLFDVEFVAALRLRLQVRLQDPAEADTIDVLDEAGQSMYLFTQTANSYSPRRPTPT